MKTIINLRRNQYRFEIRQHEIRRRFDKTRQPPSLSELLEKQCSIQQICEAFLYEAQEYDWDDIQNFAENVPQFYEKITRLDGWIGSVKLVSDCLNILLDSYDSVILLYLRMGLLSVVQKIKLEGFQNESLNILHRCSQVQDHKVQDHLCQLEEAGTYRLLVWLIELSERGYERVIPIVCNIIINCGEDNYRKLQKEFNLFVFVVNLVQKFQHSKYLAAILDALAIQSFVLKQNSSDWMHKQLKLRTVLERLQGGQQIQQLVGRNLDLLNSSEQVIC